MDQLDWLRVAAVVLICSLCLAAWKWLPPAALDPDNVSAWAEPHRYAWYALPMVMLAFIMLCLFPVLLLITLTGVAFGPLLGPIYAMAGCLASASFGFAIGRWLGLSRMQRLGGDRVARITGTLNRNGTLAVFFMRKVPAPFTLTNMVIGASTVRYSDFILGTLLGMGALVIALAGFGYQLIEAFRNPSPATVSGAVLFVGVPLTIAWFINRTLRRTRHAQ
ncbi:MAG TPA: VTT domain-containing protein [Vicinamibacterales bacterium]|nr:VTT domain-containing protein [Vicinamibacterales bacterium]